MPETPLQQTFGELAKGIVGSLSSKCAKSIYFISLLIQIKEWWAIMACLGYSSQNNAKI